MATLIDVEINSTLWFNNAPLPSEQWCDIIGFEKQYCVSNYGRILSYKTNKILRLSSATGYWGVNLYKTENGKKIRTFRGVHRLIALAFIPNPENKPQVNHKDGDKLNLKISNLEWNTASENTQHAYNNGLTHLKTGANSPNAIPINQFTLDGKFVKTWGGATCVRNELGINKSNIIQCCKKRVRQAGGFIWRYAKGGDADGTHSM